MLIPRPPAVLVFPFGPRCILHLAIDLRERLKDVDMVTSDSQLWIQTTKVIKDSEFYHSEKKYPLHNKENYHETNCQRNVQHISGSFCKHFVKFQGKKIVIHQPRSVCIWKKLCPLSCVPPLGTVFTNTDPPIDE